VHERHCQGLIVYGLDWCPERIQMVDYGHFASQCPHQRGRGRRQQASATEVDEVADRF
jgi:hypothetical protein